jgi:hypothetical protein
MFFNKKSKDNENHMIDNVIVDRGNKDIVFLFILLCVLAFSMMLGQFLMYAYDISIVIRKAQNTVFSNKIYQFPIEVIVNCLIGFVILFGGSNAGRSFLKIGYLPQESDSKTCDVPVWKTKQLLFFTLIIIFMSIIANAFQMLCGSEGPDFASKDWINAVAASTLSYAAIRSVPKMAEGVYLKPRSEKEPSPEEHK